MPEKFRFAPLPESGIQFTKHQKRALREDLPSPIYWIQPTWLTLWNITLIRDLYLNHGGDRTSPGHQRLVEEYLSTLPQSGGVSAQAKRAS